MTPTDLAAIRAAFEKAVEQFAKHGKTTTCVSTSGKKVYRVRIEQKGAK